MITQPHGSNSNTDSMHHKRLCIRALQQVFQTFWRLTEQRPWVWLDLLFEYAGVAFIVLLDRMAVSSASVDQQAQHAHQSWHHLQWPATIYQEQGPRWEECEDQYDC